MTEIHDTTGYYGTVTERWTAGPHQLVRYDTGEVRFRCVCTRWPHHLVIGALDISKHSVTWPEDGAPTVDPSILVTGPGDHHVHIHGFIRAGVWEPCSDDASVPLPGAQDDASVPLPGAQEDTDG